PADGCSTHQISAGHRETLQRVAGNLPVAAGLARAKGRAGLSLIINRPVIAAFLDQKIAATRARVAKAKAGADLRELERRAEQHTPRGFRRALAASREGTAVIAELKK